MADIDSTKPFSETQPEDHGRMMRAIPAPEGCVKFRTDHFETNEGPACRAEARLNPVTKSWDVYFTRKFHINHIYNTEKILRGLSFFDAVHACAVLQAQSLGLGMLCVTPGEDKSIPLFRDAAEEAGIPFDCMTDLPLLAVDGDILSPGTYDEHARAVAAKTKGRILDFSVRGTEIALMRTLKTEIAGDNRRHLLAEARAGFEREKEGRDKKEALQKPFREAAKAADAVIEALQKIKSCGYQSRLVPVFSSGVIKGRRYNPDEYFAWDFNEDRAQRALLNWHRLMIDLHDGADKFFGWGLSPLIIPALSATGTAVFGARCVARPFQYFAGNDPKISVSHYFNIRMKKMEAIARDMPDGPEKNMTAEFCRKARMVYRLEHVAALAEQARHEKQALSSERRFTRALNKGMKLAGKAVAEGYLDKSVTQRLNAVLYSGEFERPGAFIYGLQDMHRELKDVLYRRISSLG